MHDDGVCALALAVYKFGKLEGLRTLGILLTTSTRIKHHGALVGGKNRDDWRNPLEA
jgi:hypothetical protein